MGKLFMLVGSTVGSYFGWWIGGHAGVMTAFIVSMIGAGIGLYAGKRLASNYE